VEAWCPGRVQDPAGVLGGVPGRLLLAEVLLVAALCAGAGVLAAAETLPATVPLETVHLLLTLAAAAIGAGSAILAVVASRLLAEPRPAWIAVALVVYCVILLPWSTVVATEALTAVGQVARLLVYLTALVTMALSVRPPRRLGSWGGWALLGLGGALATASLWLPDVPAVRALIEGPLPPALVLAGWAGSAIAYLVDGVRSRDTPWLHLGLGLGVLAVAQLYRIISVSPAVTGRLAFAGLRLIGLLIVLAALALCVQRALSALRAEQWEQQEELAATTLEMERVGELAAERDHELRNGLAGLAGITHLLDVDAGGPDHEPLKHAVLAELGRLHMILDRTDTEPGEPDSTEPAVDYLVEPVLSGLVTLRRTGGNQVSLRVEPGLRAYGHSRVLAQVVTNLLTNCDRHAPGARITVTAGLQDGGVVIEVRDTGPGLAHDVPDDLFERGSRGPDTGGTGLGLHISRRLIDREGGTLRLRTVDDPRGCQATVTVPPNEGSAGTPAGAAPSGAHAPR
jgi:two-component system, OmpR family, sensor kinase